jgi:hypothetical protein
LPNGLIVGSAAITRNQSSQKKQNAEAHGLIICE